VLRAAAAAAALAGALVAPVGPEAGLARAQLAGAGADQATPDALPPAKLTALIAVVHGTGSVADDLGFGWAWGFEAAWQPARVDRAVAWAVAADLMFLSFGDEPANLLAGSIDAVELALIGRVRWAPTPVPGRFLTLGAGGTVWRASSPVPPDGRGDYNGPLAELGLEQLFGKLAIELHARLGPIATGPTVITGSLGVGMAW
jgi:hypothetical protein